MSAGVYTKTSQVNGSASMVIDASAADIWPLISDPTAMGKFSPENKGARWRSGSDHAEVGARFRGFNRRGPAVWYTECEVTKCRKNHEFQFHVSFPLVMPDVATWTWTLEASKSTPNSTKVTVSWSLPRRIGIHRRLFWHVLGVGDRETDLARGTSQTLRNLASVVERP